MSNAYISQDSRCAPNEAIGANIDFIENFGGPASNRRKDVLAIMRTANESTAGGSNGIRANTEPFSRSDEVVSADEATLANINGYDTCPTIVGINPCSSANRAVSPEGTVAPTGDPCGPRNVTATNHFQSIQDCLETHCSNIGNARPIAQQSGGFDHLSHVLHFALTFVSCPYCRDDR